MLLANELDRQGMQHLHNHFANSAATVGFLATRYLAMPWSLTLHGISETDYPAGLTLAQKIRGADFVACASWFGRAQAMRMTPSEHWNKMLIVRCGLLLEDLPVRASQAAGTRLLCVGRLSPEKGIVGLLTAIHMLRRRDVPVLLDVVGDGPDRSNIERAIASLQLQDCVRLRGQLTETETLQAIAQADLFVLPSFMEGLPVVLMEAMAIGVPVIAPRVAGIPELVEDGSGGLLFHPSNWADLADQIERMLAQPELQASFTARARLKIEEEFEISRAVKPLASRLAPRLLGTSTVGDQH
jgi:glycosyltransferase involved in cell wall biosynthesis